MDLTRIELQDAVLQTYDACESSQPITQNRAGTLAPPVKQRANQTQCERGELHQIARQLQRVLDCDAREVTLPQVLNIEKVVLVSRSGQPAEKILVRHCPKADMIC